MEYAEKHYVIPQNQMNKLRAGNVREAIQLVVENNLDVAIRNILQRSDLDLHGKAKLYSNVLQRFLTIVKQGDLESGTLILMLSKQDKCVILGYQRTCYYNCYHSCPSA